jgi:hypothetical protein
MAVYHGRKGLVYMSTTAAGAAVSVTSLNAWTINSATDKVEVTSFGDANKTYVQGLPDVQGTFGGYFNNSDTTLFSGAASTDGVKLYLYPSSDLLTSYWYGPAWVDYSLDVGVGAAVSVSANFAANGSWSRKP